MSPHHTEHQDDGENLNMTNVCVSVCVCRLQILTKLVNGVSIPVTCKIRILPSVRPIFKLFRQSGQSLCLQKLMLQETRLDLNSNTRGQQTLICFVSALSCRKPSVWSRGLKRRGSLPSGFMAGELLALHSFSVEV